MRINLALLLGVGSLFSYNEAYANAVCNIVPSCESLGYSKKESDCAEDVMLMLKCPFDNSMAYCPEDCRNYPLVRVDYKKGTYVKCATANRYKYTACNDGYDLLDGDCVQVLCDRNVYIYTHKPDEIKGEIISCTTGKDTRYGYSSCNEGWELDGANCVEKDCGPDYIFFDNIECPDNADCTDKCMSGTSEKTKITCNDGLVPQGFHEGVKCVEKNNIGSIYKYKGQPIGVVFYEDNNITKIVALHDVNTAGQPVAQNSGSKMTWLSGACYCDNIDELSNHTDSEDMNGFENTQIILNFANNYENPDNGMEECSAPAAKASFLYHPEVCEDDSFCGKGKWYLPAIGELVYLFGEYNRGAQTLIYEALHKKGVDPINGGGYGYWSSTQKGGCKTWYYDNGPTTYYNKYYSVYVRPMLIIENTSLE